MNLWPLRGHAPSALFLGASRVKRVSQPLDEQQRGPFAHLQVWARKVSTPILVALNLVAVASLSLGTMGYAAYQSYQSDLWAALHTKNALLADQLAHSLVLPFWNLDRPQMLKIIESTMQDQDIYAVIILESDPYGDTLARVRGVKDTVPDADLPRLLSAPRLQKETREVAFAKEVIGSLRVYATPARIEHQLSRVRLSMFGAILLLGGILFLSLYALLWHNVLRPLKQIQEYAVAVCDVSQDGGTRGVKHLRGEFEVLRNALGRLLREKVSLYRREHELNVGLAQQKMELQHALSVRDEFLVMASHELKTPITSLQLQLRLLQRGIQSELANRLTAQLSKSLESCRVQIQRLTRLIDDMLEVTSMRSGTLSIHLEEMNLADLIQEVTARLAPQIASAHCPLTVDTPPEIGVFWDRARIDQVLTNLVVNAIKHAQGSPIQISASQRGDETTFAVCDKGPGISKDEQGVIFERFERGTTPTSVAGLGLGLYICRRIVEAHGGTIRVESEEGQGAAFIVALPTRTHPIWARPAGGAPATQAPGACASTGHP